MHRLEITGETPEALYFNSVKMLSLLLRGAGTSVAEENIPSSANDRPVELRNDGSTPSEGATTTEQEVIPPAKTTKRGKAKVADKDAMPDDPLPDVMTGGVTIEHDAKEVDGKPPVLTLDGDIRPRLRAIQAAHSARGHDMKSVVAYIMKLYGPFGITKGDQLKPEQFAEFMEASEGYLSGEA